MPAAGGAGDGDRVERPFDQDRSGAGGQREAGRVGAEAVQHVTLRYSGVSGLLRYFGVPLALTIARPMKAITWPPIASRTGNMSRLRNRSTIVPRPDVIPTP